MSDDKDLLRKELAIILKLDAQIDYSQKAIVERYYKDITGKGLLTTPFGKRYMKRLGQIIGGDSVNSKCAFCDSRTQGDTLICPVCMAKLRKPSAVYCRSCGNKMNAGVMTCPVCGKNKDEGYQYCAHCGNEIPMPNIETITNNVKNKSRVLAEQVAKITKENVQSIAEKGTKFAGNIVTDAKAAKEKAAIAKAAKEKAGNEKKGKNMNKKSILAWLVVFLIAVIIVGTIGLDKVFAFLAVVALAVMIYMIVKKKPKKNALIAFAAYLLLSCMAGVLNNSNGMPDNVLDYMGTKESDVYQLYDKSDFYVEETAGMWMENNRTNKSGLPHIHLRDDEGVVGIILESGMNSSLNVSGLYIGDDVSRVETCMKKIRATSDDSLDSLMEVNENVPFANKDTYGLYGCLEYSCRYNGKDLTILIFIQTSIVSEIAVIGH